MTLDTDGILPGPQGQPVGRDAQPLECGSGIQVPKLSTGNIGKALSMGLYI